MCAEISQRPYRGTIPFGFRYFEVTRFPRLRDWYKWKCNRFLRKRALLQWITATSVSLLLIFLLFLESFSRFYNDKAMLLDFFDIILIYRRLTGGHIIFDGIRFNCIRSLFYWSNDVSSSYPRFWSWRASVINRPAIIIYDGVIKKVLFDPAGWISRYIFIV